MLTRRSPGEGQTAFEYFAPLKSFHAVNGPSIQEKEVNWALSSEVHGQGEKRERESHIGRVDAVGVPFKFDPISAHA